MQCSSLATANSSSMNPQVALIELDQSYVKFKWFGSQSKTEGFSAAENVVLLFQLLSLMKQQKVLLPTLLDKD